MSRPSRARGFRCPAMRQSMASRPISSAAPAGRDDGPRAARSGDRHLRTLFQPGRSRGRGARRQRGAESPGPPIRSSCSSSKSRVRLGSSSRTGPVSASAMPTRTDCHYTPIGKLLRDRGLLPPGGANMQAIKAWIRANPDQGRELMRENQSYIFFKALTGPGPLGSMGVAVTPHTTVAADPKFVPLGAPVFLRWTVPSPTACGSLRTSAARSRGRTGSTPSGARARKRRLSPAACPRTDRPSCCCRRALPPVRSLNPDEAEAWARVTATIRPLSRDRIDDQNETQAVEFSVESKTPATVLAPIVSLPKPKLLSKPEPGRTLDGTLGPPPSLRRGAARPYSRPARHALSTVHGRRSTARWNRRSGAATGCCS